MNTNDKIKKIQRHKKIEFEIIGQINNGYTDKFGVPRQSNLVEMISEIEIDSKWQPEFAFEGLEGFSHLWVQFIFHLNNNTKYHPKVHPPRLKGQSIGVFATRSPHRPNPLGLTLCELIRVEKNKLLVKGLDLVSGTPVVDLKPYLPQFETVGLARGGWALENQFAVHDIQVEFSEESEKALALWQKDLDHHLTYHQPLKKIITSILNQDPRPVIYRGYEETQNSPYRNEHVFQLYDYDVVFKFLSAESVHVLQIRPTQK